jgi:flagellar biosynthesis protein FlhB
MFTKIVKWGAIVALIVGGLLHSFSSYAVPLQFVVATAASIVLTQAARMRRYLWMTLFLVVVCLFNPVFPVPITGYVFGTASIIVVLLFFFSLELLQPKHRLSIASITDRMPGSESL